MYNVNNTYPKRKKRRL